MALDGVNGAEDKGQVYQTGNKPNIQELAKKIKINMTPQEGGIAQRKVSQQVIDKALNEPNSHKALKTLLANSPVGFGNQSSGLELESLGYTDTGMRQMHLGAPIQYKSRDGGTVTVYDSGSIDKDGKFHTDAGPRTTVYKNGGFEQTMIYDENGKLTGGKIVIKDPVGGFTERQIDFTVTADGKITTVE